MTGILGELTELKDGLKDYIREQIEAGRTIYGQPVDAVKVPAQQQIDEYLARRDDPAAWQELLASRLAVHSTRLAGRPDLIQRLAEAEVMRYATIMEQRLREGGQR